MLFIWTSKTRLLKLHMNCASVHKLDRIDINAWKCWKVTVIIKSNKNYYNNLAVEICRCLWQLVQFRKLQQAVGITMSIKQTNSKWCCRCEQLAWTHNANLLIALSGETHTKHMKHIRNTWNTYETATETNGAAIKKRLWCVTN